MKTQADRLRRRRFVSDLGFASAAGLVGLRAQPVTAEPPPNTAALRMAGRGMRTVTRGLILTVSLVGALLASWSPPGLAEPVPIAVVQDRVYRSGVFLVVDALIRNTTARTLESIEALVEFYDFFGELQRVEAVIAIPARLGPGQIAALRVVTPHSEAARKMYYRFTWRRDGEQLQATLKRDIWMIGSPTRDASR